MAENGGGHALPCHLALSRNRPEIGRVGRLPPRAASSNPTDPPERTSRPAVLTGGLLQLYMLDLGHYCGFIPASQTPPSELPDRPTSIQCSPGAYLANRSQLKKAPARALEPSVGVQVSIERAGGEAESTGDGSDAALPAGHDTLGVAERLRGHARPS